MTAGGGSARRMLAELQAGARVDDEVFRIAQKDLRTTTNGSLYVHAIIADSSGEMPARMWNASQEIYDSMPSGGLLHVRGRVENYKGNRQFIIDGVREVTPGSFDPADFLPASQQDTAALWNEIKRILRTIENRDLLTLVGKFINDPAFEVAFIRAPAAVQMHHAYIGGLAEHTLNILRLADAVCPLYPQISRDLVLAGVFLHDIGKVRELAYETNFEYTSEGQLVGHLVQCVLWLHDKCREIEKESGQRFPEALEMALKHLILSHHGKYEFGSPRLPATAEAILLHYLDNLDAKQAMVREAIEGDPDTDSEWTSYVRALETRIFKPNVMASSEGEAGGSD